jgi:hypothetical protein
VLWSVWGCDVGASGPPHFSDRRAADGRALFKQEDGLNGKKSNLLVRMVEAQIGEAYDKFNRELKARVESLYPRS